jgi:hypothetical protein
MKRTLFFEKWKTPLTDVPVSQVGNARLVTTMYERGFHAMEGMCGYDFYWVRSRFKVRALERRSGDGSWKVWMVDDPLHWVGMKRYVEELPPGEILVGGLGLGLCLHHMAPLDSFTKITVVEVDRNVIDLVSPTLPPDNRVIIVNDDFYRYLRPEMRFDGILCDIAVGTRDEKVSDISTAFRRCQPYTDAGTKLLVFGYKSPFEERGRSTPSGPEVDVRGLRTGPRSC